MSKLAALLALAQVAAIVRAAVSRAELDVSPPSPPLWGGNSSSLGFTASVNMTAPSDSLTHPRWRFHYSFDGEGKRSRYDHERGNADEVCSLSAQARAAPGRPCSVIFSAPLKAVFIDVPEVADGCCTCRDPMLGPVRSDWLRGATFRGAITVRGVAALEWLTYGAFDNHYYATADASRRPVRFMEHKNGLLKQWDFDLETYHAGRPDAALFQPPPGCLSRTCANPRCKGRRGELQDES